MKHWGVLPSMPLKWTSRGRKTLSLCGMNRGHHFRVWESASISTTGVHCVCSILSPARIPVSWQVIGECRCASVMSHGQCVICAGSAYRSLREALGRAAETDDWNAV